jgi:hypothetical protein
MEFGLAETEFHGLGGVGDAHASRPSMIHAR